MSSNDFICYDVHLAGDMAITRSSTYCTEEHLKDLYHQKDFPEDAIIFNCIDQFSGKALIIIPLEQLADARTFRPIIASSDMRNALIEAIPTCLDPAEYAAACDSNYGFQFTKALVAVFKFIHKTCVNYKVEQISENLSVLKFNHHSNSNKHLYRIADTSASRLEVVDFGRLVIQQMQNPNSVRNFEMSKLLTSISMYHDQTRSPEFLHPLMKLTFEKYFLHSRFIRQWAIEKGLSKTVCNTSKVLEF